MQAPGYEPGAFSLLSYVRDTPSNVFNGRRVASTDAASLEYPIRLEGHEMIDLVQSWVTLIGLTADIIGVVLVGKEWLQALGGGVGRLIELQANLNLAWSAEAKLRREALTRLKASGAGWFKLLASEYDLLARRMNALIYSRRVAKDRADSGLQPLAVLTADEYWNDDAIRRHKDELLAHYSNLVANGQPKPILAIWGFRLIVAGFVLQFIGALPI